MGLLDELGGGLKDKLFGGGDKSVLLDSIMGLINNPETGGLAGLVTLFKEKGLGDAVASWISTGQNLPVSASQIRDILGSDQLQQISQKAGVSREEASHGLASLLPEIIDKLTPNGKVPEGDHLAQGLNALKDMFHG